jgi:hypothetical protein
MNDVQPIDLPLSGVLEIDPPAIASVTILGEWNGATVVFERLIKRPDVWGELLPQGLRPPPGWEYANYMGGYGRAPEFRQSFDHDEACRRMYFKGSERYRVVVTPGAKPPTLQLTISSDGALGIPVGKAPEIPAFQRR